VITFQNIGNLGRLGNQMFQFASTLGIAIRKNLEAKFPIENCSTVYVNGPFDPIEGKNIGVRCDLLSCFDIDPKYFIPGNQIQISYVYHEHDFGFNSETLNIIDFCNLHGYFQSEKYFLHIKDTIKKEFTFRGWITKEGDEILESLSGGSEMISVHVRRGDYTLSPNHHPPCEPDYYKSSIEKIREVSGGDSKIIVFSDDKDWCRLNLENALGKDFLICPSDNPYIELYMMTRCNYHIIANSSFSWWGSWLSDSKMTIAPSRWFGPAMNKNTRDVYCENWIKI
jgi:hypothetical protein